MVLSAWMTIVNFRNVDDYDDRMCIQHLLAHAR